jgi:hypothetical protein
MGSINYIKPLLSTDLSSSAVESVLIHLGNIEIEIPILEFFRDQKNFRNAGIRTRGSWDRKHVC